MAPWGLPELLLRRIDLHLAGANWQRSGGQGQRPKPVDLPETGAKKAMAFAADPEQRLRNLAQMRAEEAAVEVAPMEEPAEDKPAAPEVIVVRPQDVLTFSD